MILSCRHGYSWGPDVLRVDQREWGGDDHLERGHSREFQSEGQSLSTHIGRLSHQPRKRMLLFSLSPPTQPLSHVSTLTFILFHTPTVPTLLHISFIHSFFFSYYSFQPVLHDWCNKGCGMCYPVCGMMHINPCC